MALLATSGNGDLDEAAIHARRAMGFKLHTVAAAPAAVSLVIPVHVPKRFGSID